MKLLTMSRETPREFFTTPRIIDGCKAWPYETVQGDIVYIWDENRQDIEDAAERGAWQCLALDIYGEVVCIDTSGI